jgi:hypothetical protein
VQGLKPGAFKLWVTWIQLVQPRLALRLAPPPLPFQRRRQVAPAQKQVDEEFEISYETSTFLKPTQEIISTFQVLKGVCMELKG